MATTTRTRRSRKANPGATPGEATGQDAATVTDATPEATPDTTGATPDVTDATRDATGATPGSADAGTSTAPAVAPTSAPPATNTDHLKVVIVAGVLGDQPDGLTGAELVEASGLQPGLVAKILAAMEVADVARRLPPDENGTERWVRGEGDLDTVDVANAPTTRTCPTCGTTRKISVNVGGRRSGNGNGEPGFNGDGQRKLRKNELRDLVRTFVLGNPGHMFAAGDIARELGTQEGRTISSGAVGNNVEALLNQGVIVHANPDDPHDRRVTAPATEQASAAA